MKGPSEIVRGAWGFGDVEFERSENFRVPLSRLFSYVADPRNLPSWREEVRKVRLPSRRRKKTGRGDRFVLDVLQGEDVVEVRVEVIGFEKDRLLELKIESKAYCALERYGFEEAGGGTNLEFSFKAIEPGFLVRTLALFMGSAFREDLDKKLESLKAAVASKGRGRKTVKSRLREYAASVHERLRPRFEGAGVGCPPAAVLLVGLKQERLLEVYARAGGGDLAFVCRYPVLGASGSAGPKLQEGDQQVPEGIYSLDELNPNSRYHLSLRVGYPNDFDRARGRDEGRKDLGGDIMIHGGASSVGCLAIGDEAAEELFVLVADCGLANPRLILSPVDFRKRELPLSCWSLPGWTEDLYAELGKELAGLPPAGG